MPNEQRGLLLRLTRDYEVKKMKITEFSVTPPPREGGEMAINLIVNVKNVIFFDNVDPTLVEAKLMELCNDHATGTNAVYLEQPVDRKIIDAICKHLNFSFLQFKDIDKQIVPSTSVKVEGLKVKMEGENPAVIKGDKQTSTETRATLNLTFRAPGGKVNNSGGS